MELLKIKKEIDVRLDKINFDELWGGFHRYSYALYTQNEVLLENEIIPYSKEFIGNTSLFYHGKYIAIWNIEISTIEDYDVLTSKIIHEMFHCYQFEKKETIFPNELELKRICEKSEYYQLRYYENQLLVQAMLETDLSCRKNIVDVIQKVRLEKSKVDEKLMSEEVKVEMIEGTAEYVGLKALRQLSKIKADEIIEKYCYFLNTVSLSLFDLRKITYYSGTLYYLMLERIGKNTISKIGESNHLQYPQLSKIDELYNAYQSNLKQMIEEFICNSKLHEKYYATICGYDPMNILIYKNYLYSSNFLVIKGVKETKEFRGKVVVELAEEKEGITAYWI